MDILFFAFAHDSASPLPALQREDDELYRLLTPRMLQQHFVVHRDSFTSLEKIAEYLVLFREELILFHYSGHADDASLFLDGEPARAVGIAQLLGACPKLQLVVLNGCSTRAQINLLHHAGVPAVIGTHAPVNDDKAMHFSIRLYQALAAHNGLGEAFDLAIAQILAMDDRIDVQRAAKFNMIKSDQDDASWVLSADDEQQQQWRLPSIPAVPYGGAFQPNTLLIERLIESLAPYDEEVKRIYDQELEGDEVSLIKKRKALLKCLPHPVSEQLRKLLVPETAGPESRFFDKLGIERLRQMIALYRTLTELLAFILLSEIWETLSDQPETAALPTDLQKQLQHFFQLGSKERSVFDFMPLIQHSRAWLAAQGVDCVVVELSKQPQLFSEQGRFYRACRSLEAVKTQLAQRSPVQADANTLCILAEEQLATVLGELGFLVRYTFASVKNIDAIKHRHIKKPRFKHRLVRLVQHFVGLEEEQEIHADLLDTTSVLLLPQQQASQEKHRFLNLTPFVIDENAFNVKAPIAKLLFFERYAPGSDAYAYRHIYKRQDQPLVISSQREYRVLKAQFDDFAKLVFKKMMKEAIFAPHAPSP